ncbi:MAG: pyridoxal phosphate-dependent aminotransferase [Planctomycetes bacterium]|nr:pyridoxal phosphate-dependent aminotransferase [Planctomycetota bacterium]
MQPARRLRGLVQSDIRRMTRECERVGGINLGQGICDLPTPPLVERGAHEAIRARHSTYSFMEGTAELRSAVARKLARDNGLVVDPASEVAITVGATGAYAAACMALLDPGDGILLLEPYYGYHLNTALLAGLEPQFLELVAPRFQLDAARLRAALQANTRAIVLCTPSNPTGHMLSRAEIEIVERVAAERDLLVFTDEIYEYIRYDGREHVSPATVGRLRERTVTIGGVSKTFSITGWRIGWAVAPEPLARAIALAHDLFYVCAPTPFQHAAAAGFDAPSSFFQELADGYARKREVCCAALEAAGMPPIVPEGAYYVLADVSQLGFRTARDAALSLLERAKVATVPGTSFLRGAAGERFVRVCYAKEDDVLDEACRRIRAYRP